jgi:hypothetical protein
MSYMPLPPDVESGLRRSQPSFVPPRQLTGSKVMSRNGGASRLRTFQVLSGKVATQSSLKDVADAADAAVAADGDVAGRDAADQQQQWQVPGVKRRALNLWNGMFGERHDVRMYKDLMVKQHKVRKMKWL